MTKPKESLIQEWLGNGFKSLVFCVFTMFTYMVSQFSHSVEGLTQQLKVMEQHQVDSDKRILAIEVARQVSLAGYEKIVADVQDMKIQMTQLSARTQTISDFIAKHYNK